MNAFHGKFTDTEEYTKEGTHKKGLSTLQRRIFSTISTLRMPKEMVNILLGLYKNLKRVSVTFLVQVGMKYEIPAGFYQSRFVNKIIQIQGVQFDIFKSK